VDWTRFRRCGKISPPAPLSGALRAIAPGSTFAEPTLRGPNMPTLEVERKWACNWPPRSAEADWRDAGLASPFDALRMC
jgi:hypothetical protein